MINPTKILKATLFLLVIFLYPSFFARAQNVNFIDSSLWFSHESFSDGDEIKIYTGVWNGSDDTISGTANFYDNKVILGERNFSVKPKTLGVIDIDWTASQGDHKFSVELINTYSSNNKEVVIGDFKTKVIEKNIAPAKDFQSASVIGALESFEESGIASNIDNQVSNAESFVVGLIPDGTQEVLGAKFEPVEDFRNKRIETISIKKDLVKEKIKSLEEENEEEVNEEESSSDNGIPDMSILDRPIQYVYLFFLSLLKFIYSHAILFYALSAYIIFILLRFVFRKIRRS